MQEQEDKVDLDNTFILKKIFTHDDPSRGGKYLPRDVIRHRELTDSSVRLYAELLAHANFDEIELYILGSIICMSRATVDSSITNLVKTGIILFHGSVIYVGNAKQGGLMTKSLHEDYRNRMIQG